MHLNHPQHNSVTFELTNLDDTKTCALTHRTISKNKIIEFKHLV